MRCLNHQGPSAIINGRDGTSSKHHKHLKEIRMKQGAILLLMLALVVVASGCYTVNVIGTPADQALSLSNHPSGTLVKHFSTSIWVHHIIAGLVPLNDPDVAKILSDEVKASGGTHAVNIKVNYQMTFVNGLLNVITFQIYNPCTLTIEGDVVK
jgi:hypothetical protein